MNSQINPIITAAVIRQFNPCSSGVDNFEKHYGSQTLTLLEVLESEVIPATDKIWLAVRVLPRLQVEIFALDCAVAAQGYFACNDRIAVYAAAVAAANAAADAAAVAAANAAAAADAATDAAATYASNAAAYASNAAAFTSNADDDAAYSARKQEQENSVDALILLINEGV